MRAVIIEPFSAGHRPSYVRWVAQALLAAGIDVVLVGGADLVDHSECADLSCDSARCARIALEVPSTTARGFGRLELWRFETRMRRWFESAYAAVPSIDASRDLVFVPYLDYCFHAIAILGSPFGATRWSGITMRTEFGAAASTSVASTARHHLLRRILGSRTAQAVFSIDPRSEAEIRSRSGDSRYAKLRYLPDPAEIESLPDSDSARRALVIAAREKVLLLFGSIDLRKGLEEMLRGVAATHDPTTWQVVIAGKQTPAAAAALARWRAASATQTFRIREIDSVVNSSEVATLFAAADVVWTGYPGHKASSGVLIQAALSGKPVIAQSQTLIGDLVSAANIGVACDVSQPHAVAAALEATVRPEIRDAAQRNGPLRFREHTPKTFGSRIVQAVARMDDRAAA